MTTNTDHRYTHDELKRLHDEARERALQLRIESMNALWAGIADAVSAQRQSAQRAAQRFARRLERHQKQRAATRTPATSGSC